MTVRLEVSIEAAQKRSFATAVDWPGWSRSGKTEELAIETLVGYASRYAAVAGLAGESVPTDVEIDVAVVERTAGSGATAYGVPANVTQQDRRPVSGAVAERLARLVRAAWQRFDEIAAAAPAELRKGPRGGGRDTAGIVDHVLGAEFGYARNMGLESTEVDVGDRAALDRVREDMVEIIGRASDGSPIAGRKWTTRYAAHRIAWHALDHAWEIEDRSDPAG